MASAKSRPLTFVELSQVSSPHFTAWKAAQGARCDECTFDTNKKLSLAQGVNPLYVSMMINRNGASRTECFCAQVEHEHLHKVLNALTPTMTHDEMEALCCKFDE